MSATLRIDDFVKNDKLFPLPVQKPPVLKIESRQFPVSTHFSRKTEIDDYIGAAFRKICKIHREESKGAILVFVTGQDEVKRLVARLKATFPEKIEPEVQDEKPEIDLDKIDLKKVSEKNLQQQQQRTTTEPEVFHDDDDDDEFGEVDFGECESSTSGSFMTTGLDKTLPMLPLPLYSVLNRIEQEKIFKNPESEEIRKVVIATNVAETSLTIPGIRYVVDTGRFKEKVYSDSTGIQKFEIKWISQAAADQRAGRAGRTGPGKCYRLFSSAVFQDFRKFPKPEIEERPLDDLVLGMKNFGIDRIAKFPFVTSPTQDKLINAEKLLVNLNALHKPDNPRDELSGKITELGSLMHSFPVSPRYARILALSDQKGLLDYSIIIIAACTVRDLIDENNSKFKDLKQIWSRSDQSRSLGDLNILLSTIGAAENSKVIHVYSYRLVPVRAA